MKLGLVQGKAWRRRDFVSQTEVQSVRDRSSERRYFEDHANTFDQRLFGTRANRCHRAKITRILRELHVETGDRVLEIGVGTGIHAEWLLGLCPVRYSGIDLSGRMLELARRRLGPEVQLLECPGEELPFDDGEFDAAFCSGTLHHVSDKAKCLREMARVVRGGGRVVLSEPNPWNPLNMVHWIPDPIERGIWHMRASVLRGWLQQAGLTIDHLEYFNFTPPKPDSLRRAFDFVDRLGSKTPLVRYVSSMLIIGATKP